MKVITSGWKIAIRRDLLTWASDLYNASPSTLIVRRRYAIPVAYLDYGSGSLLALPAKCPRSGQHDVIDNGAIRVSIQHLVFPYEEDNQATMNVRARATISDTQAVFCYRHHRTAPRRS